MPERVSVNPVLAAAGSRTRSCLAVLPGSSDGPRNSGALNQHTLWKPTASGVCCPAAKRTNMLERAPAHPEQLGSWSVSVECFPVAHEPEPVDAVGSEPGDMLNEKSVTGVLLGRRL